MARNHAKIVIFVLYQLNKRTMQSQATLENHPDYKNIFKKLIITKKDIDVELYHQGSFRSSDNEFHIRIPLIIYWTDKMKDDLQKRFDKLNEEASELIFKLTQVSDFDEEPGERVWDPRIYFTVEERFNLDVDPAGGYGLESHV